MIYRILLALIAFLVVALSIVFIGTHTFMHPKVLEAHTRSTFSQITARLHEIEGADFPTNESDLFKVLRASNIDWNSCELEPDRILDGWQQVVTVIYDPSARTWTFCSLGKDSKSGTADDIRTTTIRKP